MSCAGLQRAQLRCDTEMPNLVHLSLRPVGTKPCCQSPMACVRRVGHGPGRVYARTLRGTLRELAFLNEILRSTTFTLTLYHPMGCITPRSLTHSHRRPRRNQAECSGAGAGAGDPPHHHHRSSSSSSSRPQRREPSEAAAAHRSPPWESRRRHRAQRQQAPRGTTRRRCESVRPVQTQCEPSLASRRSSWVK